MNLRSALIRFAALAVLTGSIAACATPPQADLTPPKQRIDPKADLERGLRR